jgi:hypothetical protein
MRDAETVLTIVRERGERGLPLEDVYRMLYNPDLYLRAYARLYANKGAMTKGTTGETVDEMSVAKIQRLIDEVRHERHRWTPVRRVYIPKKKGGQRPLGLPIWVSYCTSFQDAFGIDSCEPVFFYSGSEEPTHCSSTVPQTRAIDEIPVVSTVSGLVDATARWFLR